MEKAGRGVPFFFFCLILTFTIAIPALAQPAHRWSLYLESSGVGGAPGPVVSASQLVVVGGAAKQGGEDWPDFLLAQLTRYGQPFQGTNFGSIRGDEARALVTDASGQTWMAGWTDSPRFPTELTGPRLLGGGDAFLVKVPPSGLHRDLILLGGEERDESTCAWVVADETRFLGGRTRSRFNIVGPNAEFPVHRGDWDGFVAACDPTGAKLWASYLGGAAMDEVQALAPAPEGGLFVAGNTRSSDFPAVAAADACPNGGQDAFLARFDARGNLLWSTFFGGGGDDSACRVAWDGEALLLLGDSDSLDLPARNGHRQGPAGGRDLFLSRWDGEGRLLWCSYFGGAGDETAADLLVEGPGLYRVLATTTSSALPAETPSIGPGGGEDILLALLGEGGLPLESVRLGGSRSDLARGMARDRRGNLFVVAETDSPDWPRAFGPLPGPDQTTLVVLGFGLEWNLTLLDLAYSWGGYAMHLAPDLCRDGNLDELDLLEIWTRWRK